MMAAAIDIPEIIIMKGTIRKAALRILLLPPSRKGINHAVPFTEIIWSVVNAIDAAATSLYILFILTSDPADVDIKEAIISV